MDLFLCKEWNLLLLYVKTFQVLKNPHFLKQEKWLFIYESMYSSCVYLKILILQLRCYLADGVFLNLSIIREKLLGLNLK